MIKKEFNNDIQLTEIESERTYFCPQIKINLKGLDTLNIGEDYSHNISLLNGQKVSIPNNWCAFSAVVFDDMFTFDLNNQNEFLSYELVFEKEKSRTYLFENMEYTIENPINIGIKVSGSHYVIDSKGVIHYIKNSFIKIVSSTI